MENRFDLYELPKGHEMRFEAKLGQSLSRKRRRRHFFGSAAAAAAAALLCVLLLPGRKAGIRWAHTPEQVYEAYLTEVGRLYELMAGNSEDADADWESILRDLTDETVPLYEQLPDELSRRERTAILKRHYGSILHGACQLQDMNKKI